MHVDVHVPEISSGKRDPSPKNKNKDPTTNLKHFFEAATPIARSNKAHRQWHIMHVSYLSYHLLYLNCLLVHTKK